MNFTALLTSNFIFIHNAYIGSLIFLVLMVMQIIALYWCIMKGIKLYKKINFQKKKYLFLIMYVTLLFRGLFAKPQFEYDNLY